MGAPLSVGPEKITVIDFQKPKTRITTDVVVVVVVVVAAAAAVAVVFCCLLLLFVCTQRTKFASSTQTHRGSISTIAMCE